MRLMGSEAVGKLAAVPLRGINVERLQFKGDVSTHSR